MSHHLMGAAEVARMLGVSRQRVAVLATTNDFPLPEVQLSAGRIWRREAVEAWALTHRDLEHDRRPSVQSVGDSWAADVARLFGLAAREAKRLNHDWIGPDHLVLAMLVADCPGRARDLLNAAGLSVEDSRRQIQLSLGDPFDVPPKGQTVAPVVQLLLERANLIAQGLSDEPSSEHVLIALIDMSVDTASLNWLRVQKGVEPGVLRDLIVSDRPQTQSAPTGPAQPMQRQEIALRATADGVDPRQRGPWASLVFVDKDGNPVVQDGQIRQYLVDRDGNPILSFDGQPMHFVVSDQGELVLDDMGAPILTPIAVPLGSGVRRSAC